MKDKGSNRAGSINVSKKKVDKEMILRSLKSLQLQTKEIVH